MITFAAGSAARICRVASSPLSTGIAMSIRITFGFSDFAISTASRPVFASPATKNSPSTSSSAHSPCRTIAWSSASSTVMRFGTFIGLAEFVGFEEIIFLFSPG